jgi:nucleobase transporter 1/2
LPTVVVGSYTYLIPIMSAVQASRYNSYTDPYEVNVSFFCLSYN